MTHKSHVTIEKYPHLPIVVDMTQEVLCLAKDSLPMKSGASLLLRTRRAQDPNFIAKISEQPAWLRRELFANRHDGKTKEDIVAVREEIEVAARAIGDTAIASIVDVFKPVFRLTPESNLIAGVQLVNEIWAPDYADRFADAYKIFDQSTQEVVI